MSTPSSGGVSAQSFTAMTSGLQYVEEAISQANSLNSNVEGEMAGLSTSFQSGAGSAFQNAMNIWREGFAGIIKDLIWIQGTLEANLKGYSSSAADHETAAQNLTNFMQNNSSSVTSALRGA
jgi:uncharacterized protein YukE